MNMTLENFLTEVQDPRRKQGQRITLTQLFSLIIISNLCGHFGGRPIARFAKNHHLGFTKELGLKYEIPSHVTISGFINKVDQQEMINAFNNWTNFYVPLEKNQAISGDGKALGSTVSNPSDHSQDFQAIVSLFCQDSGLIYALEQYKNKKESEINVVRFLVEKLEGMGLNIFLDALHCQKKQQSE